MPLTGLRRLGRRSAMLSVLCLTLSLALLSAPLAAAGQQVAKVQRIGFLHPGSLTPERSRYLNAFRQGLRDRGYVEGQNITITYRWAESREERLPDLAAELVRSRLDVLLAIAPSAVQAARNASTTIPIVALDLETDPVASGLVASLARPGGNLTGVFFDFPDFAGKWVELLREVAPQISRVAVVWDPRTGRVQMRAVEAAARALGLQLHNLEVRDPDGFEGACRAATEGHAGALLALSAPLVNTNLKRIADCASRNRLPAMMLYTDFAQAGGLMAYGPNLPDTFRLAGVFVSKILKGAKPGELPVERPVKFELVINMKTAKGLGLTVPQSLLLRADQVIDQ